MKSEKIFLQNFNDWQKQKEMELTALDRTIAYLKQLRDAVSLSSFPGGLSNLSVRKKQPYYHWVAGEKAGSYEPGMEDCGK